VRVQAATRSAQAFQIKYHNGKRFVYCEHCKSPAPISIVTHLKKKHPGVWRTFVQTFAELREQGYSYKKIMWHFGRAFSWTVIERALVEEGIPPAPAKKRNLPLQPSSFREETTTFWSFENRGSWAVHDAVYRGNWAPEVPRNLILKYSKKGDWVLDPFVGGGTTAIEGLLLRRKCVGYDISAGAVALTRNKIRALKRRARGEEKHRALATAVQGGVLRLFRGDARNMKQVPTSSVQLVCAHPPYLDIIGYTRRDPADLSTISDPNRYVREMRKIALEVFRCLKPNGIFCVLIGDVRRNGTVIPLGMKVLNALLDTFDLQEIVLKKQNRCQTTPFWKNRRFLQIQHEYLFVLKKPALQELSPD
jgi:DNA modification methylase